MRNHLLSAALLFTVACGSEAVQPGDKAETLAEVKNREAWASQDDPSIFTSQLEYSFDALPLAGEAANIPWAGSYWPTYADNINYKWGGEASTSAPKKYELAFGGSNIEDAVSRYHGIDAMTSQKVCKQTSECNSFLSEDCSKRPGREEGRCVPTWWGICHAWTPAAILLPEPKNPVTKNGVTFEVPDLKALGSLVFNSTRTKFVSLRCNKHRDNPQGGGIRLDQYGRPVDGDKECRDTNAGTYHVLLANYLGKMKQAFAEDRIADWEVWNQPLRSYKVIEKHEVTADEANRLIGVQAPAADGGLSDAGTSTGSYKFNARAVRFVQVSLQVRYISESSASTGYTGNNIDWYTHSDYYSYVLELDAAGKIIGGEWLGSSKLSHPDFLWLPLGPGSSTVAGGAISYEKVKALVLESAGPVIAPGPKVEVNETATITQGDWKHFGPYTTASGPITVDMTGTGDADLYVRLNGQPTFDLYDCRPYGSDSNESCTLNGPGPVSISVHAYAAATVALKVKFTTAAASDAGTPRVDAGTPRVDAGTPRFDAGSRPDGG